MSLIISGTTSTAGITLASANNPVFVVAGSYIFGTTSTGLYGGTAAAWTVTNSGQVRAASFGISLKSGGVITNKAAGGITGGTDGIYAAGSSSVALTVSNAGYIAGSNTISGYGIKAVKGAAVISNLYAAVIIGGYGGVYIPTGGGVGALTNNGSVLGVKWGGVVFNGGGGVANQASGAIVGQQLGVAINGTAGTVSNAGIILGKQVWGVGLGAGGVVANQSGGTIAGATTGVVISTAAGTVTNAGSITATGGKAIALGDGGIVSNQPFGAIAGSADGIYSTVGALTVTNAGNISGFNSVSGYGVKVVTGAATITNLTSATISGGNLGVYIPVGGGVGSLTNQGAVQGILTFGVYFGGGGGVANLSTGTIAGVSGGVGIGHTAGTLTNAGTIQARTGQGVQFNTGGVVTNQTSGSIGGVQFGVDILAAAGTVTNAGAISATTGKAVALAVGGVVVNQSSGTIAGGQNGIYSAVGTVTVSNAGYIHGSGTTGYGIRAAKAAISNLAAGTIAGAYIGIDVTGGGGSVINFNGGTISGGSYVGIAINGGGSVTNQSGGTISGLYDGVIISGGGSVTNFSGGTIGGKTGVKLVNGAGTVVNAGSIGGGAISVQLASGFTNRVIVDPGATFSGAVSGGNTIGSATISTLELAAAGATQGVLSGIGSQFTNFAQVSVDSAAFWAFTGANTLASGTTLTNAGELTIANGAFGDAGAIVNNGQIHDNAALTVGTLSGTGQVLIGTNSGLTTTGAVAATETIVFTGGGGLLNLTPTGFAGIIQGFESGDAIELTGVTNATSAGIVNGNTLVVSLAAGGPINLVLEPDQVYSNLIFAIQTPGGTFAGNDFIAVTGASGPTIVDGGGSMSLTGVQASMLAASNGGLGGIIVTGNNSVLSTTGAFAVGDASLGSLAIQVGGTVLSTVGATISNSSAASGTAVDVSGIGSNWQVGGLLNVGNAATGILSITAGATVIAASLNAGVLATGAGIITVSGAKADLTTAGALSIGGAGAGVLSVLNGATLNIGGDLNIGTTAGGSGNVNFADTTGTITIGANLNVGGFGVPAVLTIGTNTAVYFDNGSEFIGSGGNVILGTPFDPPAALIVAPGGAQTFPAGDNVYQEDVSNSGVLTIPAATIVTIDTPYIQQDVAGTNGVWNIGSNADLILNADTVTGQSFGIGAGGTLVIGYDQLAQIKVLSGGSLVTETNPNLGNTLIGNFLGTIDGFAAGQTIDVDTYGTATFSQSGSIVSVIQNSATVGVLTFDTVASATAAENGGAVDVPLSLCFLAGTLIRTPAGEVHVEKLVVGDEVLTASGTVRPITWIGQGTVRATRGRRNAATPVIVRKGALGPNVPHWDLHVTKGHSLFIDDVLIPVEFLVNHRSILWDDHAQEVTLYHVELETHDVLLANGAPAESYRDDGNRWLFENANSGWDQAPKEPCAPVLTGGPIVDAAWRRLLDACEPRPGLPMTDDPDLHLVADGVRVDGRRSGGRFVFPLPSVPDAARLVSLAAAPAELGLARDPRVLGIAVRRIELWQGRRVTVVEAEDDRLVDGFHGYETECEHRWTDGDGVLPTAVFNGFDGPMELVLHVGGSMRYPYVGGPLRLTPGNDALGASN